MKYIRLLSLIIFGSYLSIYSQSWINYSTSNRPLPSNQINSITFGTDGTIWIGTDSGLVSVKNSKWDLFDVSDGLSGNKINSLEFLPSDSDQLWLASNSGITHFLADSNGITSSPEYLNTADGLLSDTTNAINTDSYSNYWIGSIKGLSVFTSDEVFNFNQDNGFEYENVTAIKTLSDDWVHVGTKGGGVSRFKYNGIDGITSASKIITTWSFLASDTVLTIYVTDDTLRWYGTPNGVSTHFGDKTNDVPVTSGGSWWIYNTFTCDIIDNYVKAIIRDYEGNMWFGTKKGLSKLNMDDSSWLSYTEEDGLISNNIFDLTFDSENNLWVATDKGISVFTELATSFNIEPLPQEFKLDISNYPNPFNPATTINYTLPSNGNTKLSVFNLNGQLVDILFDGYKTKGNYQLDWTASNNRGEKISSGIYLLLLENKSSFVSKKIIFIK